VAFVFAKADKGNIRKQNAEMLLNAWTQRMEKEPASLKNSNAIISAMSDKGLAIDRSIIIC